MPQPLPEIIWLILAFTLGSAVGSFINVVVGRLPLEKSLLWPNSRCLTCLHSLAASDNLPIIGWLRRRGRCRFCGTKFSSRYMWVELGCGLGFAAIFYFDAIANWHRMPIFQNAYSLRVQGVPEWQAMVIFLHHATLFSFLLAASLCDWDHKAIPLSLTTTGTIVGLISATCFPWPWPNDSGIVAGLREQVVQPFGKRDRMWNFPLDVNPQTFPEGLYPWPVWGPLPNWLWDHRWALGLLTGLAGAAAGMILLRAIKFLFDKGLGRESLGLGDADLMMLAGAFIGWQPVIVAFFVGTFVALPLGIALRFGKKKEDYLPFGPGLAVGVMITLYWWPWLGPALHPYLFDDFIMMIAAGALLGGLFVGSILLRAIGVGTEPVKVGT
jgi:leader peptidase (prepilin peptidase)/N-methyltransferase